VEKHDLLKLALTGSLADAFDLVLDAAFGAKAAIAAGLILFHGESGLAGSL
jgi:hypothetical protein